MVWKDEVDTLPPCSFLPAALCLASSSQPCSFSHPCSCFEPVSRIHAWVLTCGIGRRPLHCG
eukprot:3533761-Rhodomonas_salina.2